MNAADLEVRTAGDPAAHGLPADQVQFSALGPIRAWRGTIELNLGSNQQQAILALLLIRANYLVSIDDLTELLWEERPPASAVNVIHKHIGAIRRLLEPDRAARAGGRWLTRHGTAYRLAADADTSDLISFRRMVQDAASAYAADQPANALELLTEALGLRRGACAEGLELCGRTRAYFSAVDQEYVAAVGQAADAALASAQPQGILPLLRQFAASEYLDESLQARLMLVLAANGQQAVALEHYHKVRERLESELGVDPGSELRDAHARVLRQELPPGGQPVVSRSSPGVPSPLVAPAQLPADLPSFAGRETELSQAAHMLSPHDGCPTVGICVIDGMAGIGKTTFAIHWAHRVAGHFQDGQLYLDLRGFDSSGFATAPEDALYALLCSLGVPAGLIPDGLDARAGLYRSVLAGKRVLVVLDNARDVRQVRPLLPGTQGCLVIATSRNPLTGLAMTDGARLVTLKLPSASTARQTLERRLGAGRVAAEPEAVEEIIRLCGQLPLALAIVSARAAHPGFTLESISAELQRTQSRLDALGPAGVASDARTVFSWSYHHLSPQACRLFRLLSLHPAADITAAASASLLGVPPDEANRLIAELTNTSLLTEDRPGRYCLHDLIRAYAAELLENTDLGDDRQAAPARLIDHYLHSLHAAQVALKPHRRLAAPGTPQAGVTPERFSDYRSALSWFTSERQVLNAVVSLATDSDCGFPAWQLALAMQHFYRSRGYFHDWLQTMEVALAAAARDADLPGQGHMLRSLAEASFHLNRPVDSLRYLGRAQAAYQQLGYTTEHAYLHAIFGEVFIRQGKLQLAIEHSGKALELYREARHRSGEVRAIGDIGIANRELGRYREAVSHIQSGIVLAHEVGTLHQEGKARKELGIVLSKMRHHDQAVVELRQALALLRHVGYRPQEAETLLALGNALSAQGLPEAATDAWRQSLLVFSTFRDPSPRTTAIAS
jgi:DNA-binding SARP family transcriptional activator/tetratricopeptide (TPR) repeat protein